MPFLKMDFAAYDNTEALSKKLECLFYRVSCPFRYTNICLFLRIPLLTKSRWQKFVYSVQLAWTICLSSFIIVVAGITICAMPPLYYCVYLTGCIDYFYLIYWNRTFKDMEYYKRLKKSSAGVGMLRNAKKVLLRRNVSLAIGIIFSVTVLPLCTVDAVGLVDLLPRKSIPLPLYCIYLSALFLVLAFVPAANSTAFCYIESVAAEFEMIDHDFAHDVNKYQLPVVRHYIRGHGQLLKMFDVVKHPLSAWCSLHILLNFFTSYKVFCFLYASEYKLEHILLLWKPAVLSFLLVFALVQTTFIFYCALILRKQILGIRCGMLKVIISERLPHEQVFPLLSLHLLDLHHQVHGLSFIGLWSFDRHLLTAFFCIGMSLVIMSLNSTFFSTVLLSFTATTTAVDYGDVSQRTIRSKGFCESLVST